MSSRLSLPTCRPLLTLTLRQKADPSARRVALGASRSALRARPRHLRMPSPSVLAVAVGGAGGGGEGGREAAGGAGAGGGARRVPSPLPAASPEEEARGHSCLAAPPLQ